MPVSAIQSAAVLLAALLWAQPAAAPPEWSYDGPAGPSHWASLSPGYAACDGHAQSPVDIRKPIETNLPPIRFDYRAAPLKYLIDNTHALRVNYHDADSRDFLTAGGKRYEPYQFHFHHPSEETLNGKAAAMDLHLMHRAADGSEAAVAIMLEPGPPNPELQKILDHAPQTTNKELDIHGVTLDPAGLLPAILAYYSYPGSLAGPPCTENVTWYVLKTPITVSPAQLAAYGRIYPHNVRPVQPLNGRIVQSSAP